MDIFKNPPEEGEDPKGEETTEAPPLHAGKFPAIKAPRGRRWLLRWLRLNWPVAAVAVAVIGLLLLIAGLLAIRAARMPIPAQSAGMPLATASPGMHNEDVGTPLPGAIRVDSAGNPVGGSAPPGVDPAEWQRYLVWRQHCPNGQCSSPGGGAQLTVAQQRAAKYEELMEKVRAAHPDAGNNATTTAAHASAPVTPTPTTPTTEPTAPAAPQPAPQPQPQQQQQQGEAPWNSATGPRYILPANVTIIKARLLNGITGEARGPILAEVVQPVYSWDLTTVLIPKGTYFSGHYDRVQSQDQERLLLGIDSMTFPDMMRITFPETTVEDQTGQVGVRDLVNHHYAQLFLTAVGIATVTGGATSIGSGGYTYSPVDVLRIGIAQGGQQAASQAFSRFAQRPVTLTIRPGKEIVLFPPIDLELPAWKNHTVRSPL